LLKKFSTKKRRQRKAQKNGRTAIAVPKYSYLCTLIYKHPYMFTPLLFGSFGATEIIILALLVLLLFGGKKIPELMRGIGKGVRTFKEGIGGIEEEVKKDISDPKKDA